MSKRECTAPALEGAMPAIVCPSWCQYTVSSHLEQLETGPTCVHEAYIDTNTYLDGRPLVVGTFLTTMPDGTPIDPLELGVIYLGGDMPIEQAEKLVEALTAAIATAKATRTELTR